MPIEIKELHIRVTVNADEKARPAAGASRTGAAPGTEGAEGRKDEVLSSCVEQVMQILHDKKER